MTRGMISCLTVRRIIISDLRYETESGYVHSCTLCGKEAYVGGFWKGSEDIVVCSHMCAQKLLLLALDTISSINGSMPYAEWMTLADKTYDRWEQYQSLQEKNREQLNESLCPVCQMMKPEAVHANR